MMTNSKSTVRTLIAAAAVLVATSGLATAYSNDALSAPRGASSKALPGVTAQLDPCGPRKVSGPLGY